MDSRKRSRNFTEREKMLLLKISKDFVSIIDNIKTDGISVEAKKKAWMDLTNKYNSASETGLRTEKQLHALYDNLKKKARRNISDDKCEMYKTGDGTFCPKTTEVDEEVVQKKSIHNICTSIIKRKNQEQQNEDMISRKKMEILQAQHEQEIMKLEKNKILYDLDIEIKKVLLENAKLDLELKKKNLNS